MKAISEKCGWVIPKKERRVLKLLRNHTREYEHEFVSKCPSTPRWKPDLKGIDRLRLTCTALTRMRFCNTEGEMDFTSSGGLDSAPPGYMPWFDVPARKSVDTTVVFGHWAALGLMVRDNVIGLDSGCVWGNQLSAIRLTGDPAGRVVTQVDCAACRGMAQPD